MFVWIPLNVTEILKLLLKAKNRYYEISCKRLLFMIQVQTLVGDPHKGHLGSDDMTSSSPTDSCTIEKIYRHGRGLNLFVLSRRIA